MMNLEAGRVCQTGELLSSGSELGWGSHAGQKTQGWAGLEGIPGVRAPWGEGPAAAGLFAILKSEELSLLHQRSPELCTPES